jgi:transcriptional regulator with XRE-family HTH domain
MTDDSLAEMELRKLFGANIRQLRKRKGLTQNDLSTELGVTLDMIGRLERGTVGASFKTIVRLTQLFNVDACDLFSTDFRNADSNARGRSLNSIALTLSKMTDDELARAQKLLIAMRD